MIFIWTKEGWLTGYVTFGSSWTVDASYDITKAMVFSDYSKAQKVANAIDSAHDAWIMESLPL